GSIRFYAAPASPGRQHGPAVLAFAEAERQAGLADVARLRRFAEEVAGTRSSLLALLRRLRAEGATIAAYGAPAKGNTLLNYCKIGTDLVAYAVDRNPLKQGRYTPGQHLPVPPAEVLLERQPDYVLILAWNFAREIVAQQAEYARRGGRFILPLPVPRIL
ncbi:MAG: methyltransferase C-terminal domain-containing protein, partial [Gemmatimonadota bacterium]|nr:methyltransferase C-terminal domain-containing protein [Gemmatimonadota bacterium]